MQEFADRLYLIVLNKESTDPKSHTVKRIREIIEKKGAEKGTTIQPFLDALIVYWGALSDLVQRQEHVADKDGEKLTWDDSRRIVFQTINVMGEFHRTLEQ